MADPAQPGPTWEQVYWLAGLVLTLAGIIAGYFRSLRNDLNNHKVNTVEQIASAKAEAAKEISDFKQKVANEYASVSTLEKFETRITDAINRLGDRFDSYFRKE